MFFVIPAFPFPRKCFTQFNNFQVGVSPMQFSIYACVLITISAAMRCRDAGRHRIISNWHTRRHLYSPGGGVSQRGELVVPTHTHSLTALVTILTYMHANLIHVIVAAEGRHTAHQSIRQRVLHLFLHHFSCFRLCIDTPAGAPPSARESAARRADRYWDLCSAIIVSAHSARGT